MKKIYNKEILTELSYQTAVESSNIAEGKGDVFLTRPNTNEIHFMIKDNYFILNENKKLIVNSKDVKNLDKNDWMIVSISEETLCLINKLVKDCYDKRKSLIRK